MLHTHFVEAAAAHWVEAVLDGFFESGRAGDDELWGTVLVDGDGSTNTQVNWWVLGRFDGVRIYDAELAGDSSRRQ